MTLSRGFPVAALAGALLVSPAAAQTLQEAVISNLETVRRRRCSRTRSIPTCALWVTARDAGIVPPWSEGQ